MSLFPRKPAPEWTMPPAEPPEVPPPPVDLDPKDLRHILTLVRRALVAESLRPAEMRNQPLVDLALDVRSVILPPAPDRSVPVIPGRSS